MLALLVVFISVSISLGFQSSFQAGERIWDREEVCFSISSSAVMRRRSEIMNYSKKNGLSQVNLQIKLTGDTYSRCYDEIQVEEIEAILREGSNKGYIEKYNVPLTKYSTPEDIVLDKSLMESQKRIAKRISDKLLNSDSSKHIETEESNEKNRHDL